MRGGPSSNRDHHRIEVFDLLDRLHRHKDVAYGDAWRKRGEVIAIFANMARKYDRLLVAFDEQRPAATEPLGDTVADLCIYAGKYLTWIAEQHPRTFDAAGLPMTSSRVTAARGPDALRDVLDAVVEHAGEPPCDTHEAWTLLQHAFEELERALMAQATLGSTPDDIPSYGTKACLAWHVSSRAAWLLVELDRHDEHALAKLRDDVAAMDQAAGK